MNFFSKEALKRFHRKFHRRPRQAAPQQTEPQPAPATQHETKESLPSNIVIKDNRAGLVVHGWDGVESALRVYPQLPIYIAGSTPGPDYDQEAMDWEKYGQLSEADFLTKWVMPTLRGASLGESHYFGYTSNKFAQTHLTVSSLSKAGSDALLLSISTAAKILNQPDTSEFGGAVIERAISEKLGLERAITSRNVYMRAPQNAEAIAVNIDGIVEKFRTMGLTNEITSQAIIKHFLFRGRYDETKHDSFILGEKDGFTISMNFSNVGYHYDFKDPGKTERWQVLDGKLIIPLTNPLTFNGENPIGIVFHINPTTGERVVSVEAKKRLDNTTRQLISALQ